DAVKFVAKDCDIGCALEGIGRLGELDKFEVATEIGLVALGRGGVASVYAILLQQEVLKSFQSRGEIVGRDCQLVGTEQLAERGAAFLYRLLDLFWRMKLVDSVSKLDPCHGGFFIGHDVLETREDDVISKRQQSCDYVLAFFKQLVTAALCERHFKAVT